MADLLVFGGNTLPFGVSAPSINRSYELDQWGVPWLEIQRWEIPIRLVKTSTSPIDTQIQNIETFFETPATSMHILDGSGAITAHQISTDEAIGDIRLVGGPSYAALTRGENVTVRNCTVTLEAVLPKYTDPLRLVEFNETTVPAEVGPTQGILQPNIGQAVIQQTRTAQHRIFVQSGTIRWAAAYGLKPAPRMPTEYLVELPRVTVLPRRFIGPPGRRREVGPGLSYQYQFLAPASLIAAPTPVV
ncbi:MAG: hypothetical protein AAGJ40_09330 [Planctomycetota bacterium]